MSLWVERGFEYRNASEVLFEQRDLNSDFLCSFPVPMGVTDNAITTSPGSTDTSVHFEIDIAYLKYSDMTRTNPDTHFGLFANQTKNFKSEQRIAKNP